MDLIMRLIEGWLKGTDQLALTQPFLRPGMTTWTREGSSPPEPQASCVFSIPYWEAQARRGTGAEATLYKGLLQSSNSTSLL